jgi:hypothetical protein
MKVFVYYNLHKKVFSIKALEGSYKGLVIRHASELTLHNVQFRVSQAGRARVLREQKKNVHAGVVGQWFGGVDQVIKDTSDIAVTYNPYKYSSFVYADGEQPIFEAQSAYLVNRKIFI